MGDVPILYAPSITTRPLIMAFCLCSYMAHRFKDLRPWQKELVDRLRAETGDYYIFHANVTERAGKSWLIAWAHTQPDIITLPFSPSIASDLFERVENGWKGVILLETTRSNKHEHNESVLQALLGVKQGVLQMGKKHKTIEPPQICVLADVAGCADIYGRYDQHIIECRVSLHEGNWVTKWWA